MKWCRNCWKPVETTFLFGRCKVCNGPTMTMAEREKMRERFNATDSQLTSNRKIESIQKLECPYCDSPFIQFMKSTLQLEHHILVCHGINVTSGSISYPNDRMRVKTEVDRINKLIEDTNKQITSMNFSQNIESEGTYKSSGDSPPTISKPKDVERDIRDGLGELQSLYREMRDTSSPSPTSIELCPNCGESFLSDSDHFRKCFRT